MCHCVTAKILTAILRFSVSSQTHVFFETPHLKHQTETQSKDFIDEILNLDSTSLDEALKFEKLLADDILIKQEPEELSIAEVRDRQKKDNHNMSEYH